MVKSSSGIKSFLVLVMVMVSAVTMANSVPILSPQSENTEDDSSMRIERSAANISHITGTSRKIRMLIRNNKYIQIFADGTVNATDDGNSDHSIIQRSSVNAGQVKIQGVATCAFLCMDSCGFLYSTRDFDDECIFYENTESNSYNSYSSVKYSNDRYIYYIGTTKRGVPRQVRIKADEKLGKFSECTNVLPKSVDSEEVERLTSKILAQHSNSRTRRHNVRHHNICPPPYHMKITESVKCKQKRSQKRKKRKCHENEGESDKCHAAVKSSTSDDTVKKSSPHKKASSDTETGVETHQPKKNKKRKDTKKNHKQGKSAVKKDTNLSGEKINNAEDADDTMTTIIPEEGADDEFLDKE